MKIERLEEKIEIPDGVTANIDGQTLTVKGPKGELTKYFPSLKIQFSVENGEISIFAVNATKREKTMLNTFKAHVNNMISGVRKLHTYKLKICSGHFPMNVTLKDKKLSVKNYIGEKIARDLIVKRNAEVKLDGQEITVTSVDIEEAGNTAAQIEKLMRITNRDRRIFQDGIWITSKPHRTTI